MLLFSLYVVGIIYCLLYCYLFSKTTLKEKFVITKRMIAISLVMAIFLSLNFYYNKTPLKPFVSHILFFITIQVTYNQPIVKTLVGLLISFVIVSISELAFAFTAVNGLHISNEQLNETISGLLVTNICIMILAVLFINIKKIKYTIENIVNTFIKDKSLLIVGLAILCLAIATFVIYQNFFGSVSITYLVLINLFFIGVYVFMFGFFIERTNNNQLTTKYDQLYSYSKTSEQELVNRSKRQHEYKNQLVIIKSMVEENDPDTISYIENLLNEELKSNDLKWLTRLANIPLGGLKGL